MTRNELERIISELVKAHETTQATTNKPADTAADMEKEEEARIISTARASLEEDKQRSAWNKGVTAYALELLESLEEALDGGYFRPDDLQAPKVLEKALLDGASDWGQYSWGGCSLCYDPDIAARLCTPSELKRTHNGERRPNSREEWLDTQARALYQAARRVKRHIAAAVKEVGAC